jgi:hypothetical protein
MRKRIITPLQSVSSTPGQATTWLNLDAIGQVDISSETADYPIEAALVFETSTGWRAAEPGTQTIRLIFDTPQALQRIWLNFVETEAERTQEYLLQWSADGQTFHEIVRQRWNFNLHDATGETEDHQVDLPAVSVLELIIIPNVGDQQAYASLQCLRLA